MDEIKDDASFQASLTTDAQKTYYTNALQTASTAAVSKFKTEAEDARKKAVPEKYELKFADHTSLDPAEDVEKIAAYARTQGFSNEQAQTLAALIDERAQRVTARHEAASTQEAERWRKDVEADKELGGERLTETAKLTQRVMDRFAPKDSAFRKLLNDTGYGNHPEFVRFVRAIGQAMAEDRPSMLGGGPGHEPKPIEKRLYPTMA